MNKPCWGDEVGGIVTIIVNHDDCGRWNYVLDIVLQLIGLDQGVYSCNSDQAFCEVKARK